MSLSQPQQQQKQADVLNFPCEGQRKYLSRSDVVISGLRLWLGWPRANTRRRDGGEEERGERGAGLSEPICVSLLGGGAAFGRQAALQNGRNTPRGHGAHCRSDHTGDTSSFYCLNARERVKGESISTKLTSVFVLFCFAFCPQKPFSHM